LRYQLFFNGLFPLADDLVNQPVVLGFAGREEVVALGVLADFLQRLAGALGQNLVELFAGFEDFAMYRTK